MAGTYDGSIRIDTSIDTSGFSQGNAKLVLNTRATVAKIAAEYKKAGKDSSEAFSQAWADVKSGNYDEKFKVYVEKAAEEGTEEGIRQGLQRGFGPDVVAGASDGLATGLRRTLSRIAGFIASAFVVNRLVNFGKEAVSIASDLKEVENVVTTAFGSMTGQVEEWASRSIQQFGMSELVAKQTASTYMAMSRGMGLVGQAAADMAMDVAGLSADMASFYNVEQDVAATALQSIWTGETESLNFWAAALRSAA